MHKDIAIKLHNISKVYKLYDKQIDRLKESLHPLKKQYHKEFFALKNINLEIKKGEVLGIVGVNGAGKSTLLKIIAGVLTPTSGRITINGRINAILELSSGLKSEMTGRENIKLNLQINSIYSDAVKITQEIIDFADIGDHIDQPIKTYSSGMKARLGFGIATSTDPDILIVDEVLAVGDVLFQRKCYSKIEKLFKDGKTVIFVSHSAQSVIEFCSRAILLYDKEIIEENTPKIVTDLYQKLVFSKDKAKVITQASKKSLNIASSKESEFIKGMKLETDFNESDFFEFDNIYLKNENDDIVNNINDGSYCIEYKVKIKKAVQNIFFGVQIKSLTGLIISGINSKEQLGNTIESASEHDQYIIKMDFSNILLSGTYIVDIFVRYNEEELFLKNSAYIFKVQKKDYKQAGFVSLNQKIAICNENGRNVFEK